MICSLNSCLESITNPAGRFATLEELFCQRDGRGAPCFSITSYSVNFAVEWCGADYTLKCQVCDNPEVRRRAESFCRELSGVDSPFLVSCRYCPGEMMVFDDTGSPQFVDVILQRRPQGVGLDRFVDMCSGDSSRSTAVAAFGSLCRLARWCGEFGMVHRNLKPHNIIVSPLGHVSMVNYEFAAMRRGNDDVGRLLAAAAALLLCGAAPLRAGRMARSVLSGHGRSEALAVLSAAAAETGFHAAGRIAELCAEAEFRGVSLDEMLEVLTAAEPAAAELYGDMGRALCRLLDGAAPECVEHDFTRYEMTGPECDGMICVKDGSSYRYLDRTGRRVIGGDYLYASDFAEGRAVVADSGGMSLIDLEARCVLGPGYDDLAWDCDNNLAMAAVAGRWGLFDRDGNPLTGMTFDWMGECDCGRIPVERAGRFGYIDTAGVEVISCRYDRAYSFRGGAALVELDGRQFHIDTAGNRTADPSGAELLPPPSDSEM